MRRPPHARGTRGGCSPGLLSRISLISASNRGTLICKRRLGCLQERVNGGGSLSPAKCAPPSGCRPNFNPQLVSAPSRASFTGRHLRLVGWAHAHRH